MCVAGNLLGSSFKSSSILEPCCVLRDFVMASQSGSDILLWCLSGACRVSFVCVVLLELPYDFARACFSTRHRTVLFSVSL